MESPPSSADPSRFAWRVKTLPVVDGARNVVGIAALTDFLDRAPTQALGEGAARAPGDRPEVVGQIMTRRVRVTREHRTLSDLVHLFASSGHRHIPVVGEGGKLVGMVTQSDVVAQ